MTGGNSVGSDVYAKIALKLYELTGVYLKRPYEDFINSRLTQHLNKLNLTNLIDYLDFLVINPEEESTFVDALTTHETYFARSPRVWEFIQKKIIPDHIKFNLDQPLRIWSAATSTGAEAYTLAMLCREICKKNVPFQFEIIATDISAEVVATAKAGIYSQRAIENLKKTFPGFVEKYFDKSSDRYSIHKELKADVEFKTHNLFKPLKYSHKFDLILMRNVLIYFTEDDQIKVTKLAFDKLRPGGSMIVGESDSLNQAKTDFNFIEPSVYQRKAG